MYRNSNAPLVNSFKKHESLPKELLFVFVGGFLKKAPTPPKTFDMGLVRRPFAKSKFIEPRPQHANAVKKSCDFFVFIDQIKIILFFSLVTL